MTHIYSADSLFTFQHRVKRCSPGLLTSPHSYRLIVSSPLTVCDSLDQKLGCKPSRGFMTRLTSGSCWQRLACSYSKTMPLDEHRLFQETRISRAFLLCFPRCSLLLLLFLSLSRFLPPADGSSVPEPPAALWAETSCPQRRANA